MVNLYIFVANLVTPHLLHQLQILSLAIGADICTVQHPSEFENTHDSFSLQGTQTIIIILPMQ